MTVLVLLALALFTRFFGIGFQSLWIDEGPTYWFYHIPWDDPIYETEPNPHLFYSMEELNAYVTGPAYGDVYVIILQDYDPYNLLSSTTSANCRCIFSGYDMSVYEITGPL